LRGIHAIGRKSFDSRHSPRAGKSRSRIPKIAKPFRLYGIENGESQRLAHDLESLKAENADLESRIKHIKTKEGVAQAARKIGLVKPGEILLVLPPEKK